MRTIVGLEGSRVGDDIVNLNYAKFRGEIRRINFAKIAEIIAIGGNSLKIQIGGLEEDRNYLFRSQGEHPYVRSFAIQERTAVVMAWPRYSKSIPCVGRLKTLAC